MPSLVNFSCFLKGLPTPPRFRPSLAAKNARSVIDHLRTSIDSPSGSQSSNEGAEMRSPKRRKTQSGVPVRSVDSPDYQSDVQRKAKQKDGSSGKEPSTSTFPMSEAREFKNFTEY